MKDAYYFSHDYNPTSDPKIQALIGEYGAVGYGIFWRIVEMLHEDELHKLPCKQYIYLALAKQLLTSVEQVSSIVDYCINVCELFQSDNTFFWSERVIRNISKRTEISNKRSKAGKISAESRKNTTSVEHVSTGVEQNSTNGNKGKESKGKENKGNKIKDNKDIHQDVPLDESYIKFNLWIKDNAPNVMKINKQITERQFLSLKEKYSSRQIMEVIESLDNYAPAPKKYVSVYSTVSEWIKRRNKGNEVKENKFDSNNFEEIYNGKRTYLRGKTRFAIPDDAPNRPSNNHSWSDVSKQWVYLV